MKQLFGNLFFALGFWFVVGFALFLTTDKLILPILSGQFKSTVETPKVLGLSLEKAEALVEQAELGARWSKEGKYSSTVPMGHVLLQNPKPGRVVKTGRNVIMTVSKGLREVAVPALRGKSKRQAEISLDRMGLYKGKNIAGGHASIPRGVIIRTIPDAGRLVRIGDTITLVISSGIKSGRVLLPSLTGLSLEQAKETLANLNFILGNVQTQATEESLPNTVINSSPKSGEYLSEGDTISLQITE